MPRFTPVAPGFPIAPTGAQPHRHRARPQPPQPFAGGEVDALFSRPGPEAD